MFWGGWEGGLVVGVIEVIGIFGFWDINFLKFSVIICMNKKYLLNDIIVMLNYDLLLYWSVLWDNVGLEIIFLVLFIVEKKEMLIKICFDII